MDTSSSEELPPALLNSSTPSVQNEATPLLDISLNDENVWYHRMALIALGFLFITGIIIGAYLMLLEKYDTGYYDLIMKTEWTELEPKFNISKLKLPVKNIFIVELNSTKCVEKFLSTAKCLQHVQRKHILELNEPDILYNFIIDESGSIYEGRGWVNSTSNKEFSAGDFNIAMLLLGKIKNNIQVMKHTLHNFLENAVITNKLEPCFKIFSYDSTYINEVITYIDSKKHFC